MKKLLIILSICILSFFAYKGFFYLLTGSFTPNEQWHPVCVRENYYTLGDNLDWVKSEKPSRWVCVCGVSGAVDDFKIGEPGASYDSQDNNRLISNDIPIPDDRYPDGHYSIKLECRKKKPDLQTWGSNVWAKTKDGLFCRVPKGFH